MVKAVKTLNRLEAVTKALLQVERYAVSLGGRAPLTSVGILVTDLLDRLNDLRPKLVTSSEMDLWTDLQWRAYKLHERHS